MELLVSSRARAKKRELRVSGETSARARARALLSLLLRLSDAAHDSRRYCFFDLVRRSQKFAPPGWEKKGSRQLNPRDSVARIMSGEIIPSQISARTEIGV